MKISITITVSTERDVLMETLNRDVETVTQMSEIIAQISKAMKEKTTNEAQQTQPHQFSVAR